MCHYFRHSRVGGEKGRGQLGWQCPFRGRNPLLCTSRDLPRASWTCHVLEVKGRPGTTQGWLPPRGRRSVFTPPRKAARGMRTGDAPGGLASWSRCWESQEPGPAVWERKTRSVWVRTGKLGQASADRWGGQENQRQLLPWPASPC